MTTEFSEILACGEAKSPQMHLTHGTYAAKLSHSINGGDLGILDKGRLEVRYCSTLKADLVFFFYGRTDYEPKSGTHFDHEPGRGPVYFIFDPSIIEMASYIYPFDTGGHENYNKYTALPMTWRDFLLETIPESPRRVVDSFFGSNANYFDIFPIADVKTLALPPEAMAYHKLITSPPQDDDGRCSAIEVSIGHDVELLGALKMVIAPGAVLSRPEVRDRLSKLACRKVPIQLPGVFKWRDFRSEVRSYVRRFYKQTKVL
jgi:hypothetical protein